MRVTIVALATLAATLALVAMGAAADRPLMTGIFDPETFHGSGAELGFDRTNEAGGDVVRLVLNWESVAPAGATKPLDFLASDPSSPYYRWSNVDSMVTKATSRGLEPIVSILPAPEWARSHPARGVASPPIVSELQEFALAAARRYDGVMKPRVRYWQVWNEPNISLFFAPQFVDGAPFSPGHYRAMVNAVAASAKAVHADNLVVAGGTAPFHDNTPEVTAIDPDWGPLSFARRVLCLSEALTPTCAIPVTFDVWAHHPYTSGGPTHHATSPNSVSIADLPELRAVLQAAQDAGHLVAPAPVQLWVTEFSWDSSPPDPNGVPESLITRWTAEGLYRMWEGGVSLLTWFTLRDYPVDSSPYQSGFYLRGASLAEDTPKPSLAAFRFPVVAFPHRDRIAVWGRTPGGVPAEVVIEQSFSGGWALLATVTAGADGVFRTVAAGGSGSVRARALGAASVPFSLDRVPDQIFHPFGGVQLEPSVEPPPRPVLPAHIDGDSDVRVTVQTQLREGP